MVASPTIRRIALAATLLILLPAALLNTRLDLERQWRASHERRLEDISFPSAKWIRLLSLNYNTLAADLMWLMLTAQHGEYVSQRDQAAENVLDNGEVLAGTDPHFYQLFHWVSGAYLSRRFPITDADLHRVADLMEIGMRSYPQDEELRLSAALLFTGYGRGFSRETLARQSARAVEYLDEAVRVAPDDSQLVAIRRFFRHRQQKYGGGTAEDEQADAQFWFDLLTSTTDDRVRRDAAAQLKRLGAFDSMVRQNVVSVLEEHQEDKPYLPVELWVLLHEEKVVP